MKVSCIQITARDSIEENISIITPMVAQAANEGATLVTLPENALLMAAGRTFHRQVTLEKDNDGITSVCQLAKKHHVWILLGSVAVQQEKKGKYANRQLLVSPEGKITARYDKIHLFDVSIAEGESHKESDRFYYGEQAVIAQAAEATLGLSICYDVRFPYLYRALAKAGAQILTIPAAFTRYTGEKGAWHVLCRARAIETGCYVVAAAQCGEHAANRKTYGHSLIINPWGEIMAEAGQEPCIITAEIDLAEVAKTQQTMPSLSHERVFSLLN